MSPASRGTASVELFLVRHGQSTANRDGILQGRSDAPLSELGRRQAAHLGGWFKSRGLTWHAVYSSPLLRARDTAGLIIEHGGGPAAIEDADLEEVHVGAMQGKPHQLLHQEHPSFYQRGIEGMGDYSEFGGEAYADVQVRVQRFMSKLHEQHRGPEQRVLVVSHGGLLFQLTKAVISLPVPRAVMLRFSNCSVTRLRFQERRGTYIGELEWHLPIDLTGGEPSGGAAALLY
jgi:broad specificity phosphatase PhoE